MATRRIEICGVFPDRYEYVVKNILGFGGIVENIEGSREKWLCKAVVKFAKGRLVSGGDSLENLRVDRVLLAAA